MKYLSLFSGIGGFEKGIEEAGLDWECVGFSEIDKYAISIYNYHYPNHKNYGDVSNINVSGLPDFNLLVGGFPCQSFSIAGKGRGFEDARGTLFFEIARILEAKRPEWLLLENVKNLLSHDDYKTIFRIYEILTELGYSIGWEVVNSCHFGVPQSRERIFIVGHLRTAGGRAGEILPFAKSDKVSTEVDRSGEEGSAHLASTLTKNYHKGVHGCGETYISGTWRTHKDGQGFREVESGLAPTIPARAREDGSGQPVIKIPNFIPKPDQINKTLRRRGDSTLTPKHNFDHIYDGAQIRRLTPKECERLQGFPDGWTAKGIIDGEAVEISDTQRYKTLGNAVTVNVIGAISHKIGGLNV